MVGSLTQQNGHAKSRSTVIFLLRSNAGFCRHYTIIDLVSSSLKFTMYGGDGGGSCNGIGGGGGGACGAGVVGACGAGSSWQEKTTTTNYNTYVVVVIPGVCVAILMILGLQ